MKRRSFIWCARTKTEKWIMEDILRSRNIRYETWRTMEDPNMMYIHYFCIGVENIAIKLELLKTAFELFREERREKRASL